MKTKMLILLYVLSIAFLLACSKDESGKDINKSINYNAAYVVNSESNTISVINLETNEVEKTLNIAQLENGMGYSMGTMNMDQLWPHHINISPDGSKIAIAAPGMDFSTGHNLTVGSDTTGGTGGGHLGHHKTGGLDENPMQGRVLIVDAVSGVLLKEYVLEGMTHNAVFSPDSEELWVSIMMTEGSVKVIDLNNYTLTNSIAVGPMPMEVTFSDDGSKAYVTNGMAATVSIIDVLSKTVIETITTGEVPIGAWPGINGMMYVGNENSQNINMLSMMTNMMTDSLNLGFMPGMVMRNPVMNQMCVTDPANNMIHFWTVTDTGYMHSGEIIVGSGAHAIAISIDGNTAYVTNQLEGTVSVVNIKTGIEKSKISVGVKPNGIVLRYIN